ncbi:MAG: subfamily B ATP-binding cassette protein MsbA [Candidatus Omnitrophota bacterium]|jgi:subfamily B ATP-binding cassette protein MsbA
MKNYLRLISFVRPHIKILGLAAVCMFTTTLFKNSPIALIIPVFDRIFANKPIIVPDRQRLPQFLLDVIDRLNAMDPLTLLGAIVVISVVMTTVFAISRYLQTILMNEVGHRVTRDIRLQLYAKMIHLPLRFFGKQRAGDLVSRITYDTGVVRDAIAEGLLDVILQPMELIANIVMLLSIRWAFGIPWSLVLIITVVLPLVAYPIIRIGKALKKISTTAQKSMADINSSLFESVSGVRVVKAFGMESYEEKRFAKSNHHYYASMMKLIKRNQLIQPLTDIVNVICGATILWLGGRLVLSSQMSPGAFFAFSAALFSIFRPFKRLSRLYGINQMALAAGERVFAIMDEHNEIQEIEKPIYLPGIKESIQYSNVDFEYEKDQPILKKINFELKAGQILAVVGSSGSGKSTLLNLLPRFYDPISGEVRIDGVAVNQVAKQSLMNLIGIVTQETILFNDTVAANIAYGQSHMDQAKIEEAARIANASDFIQALPNGYQTRVGDRGFKLSGGEKQRIAIARAILKNPPILMLDEATSSLDAESEQLVQKAIHELMQGRTVLVIAHRLSTIKDADRILVLKDGCIVQEGQHDELLSEAGDYKKLYDLQFASTQ